MTILYALIARGKTVLAEYTFTSGNFPTITRLLLGKIQLDRDGKMSYVYDQYIFHYVCHDHILYLCMCDDPTSSKRRVPFNFLEDIRQRFVATYGDQAQTASRVCVEWLLSAARLHHSFRRRRSPSR